MKKIKYQVRGYTQVYNSEKSKVENIECLVPVFAPWTEANEETAKQEAYNGEYTIEDIE